MTLNTRPSSHAFKRIASLLGVLVLSTVLVPITLAAPSFSVSPALTPAFSSPVSTATGFTVNVTNYNSAFTFAPTVSAGTVVAGVKDDHTLGFIVSALAPGASATITVTTTRTDYVAGSASVMGTALLAALIPTFSSPVSTATGFTINVTNYDPAYKFTLRTSAGHAVAGLASGTTLPLTITQMNARSSATVTVSTTRTGYASGRSTVTGNKLPNAALVPTFSTPVSTATGFTVNVTNYNSAFTFTPTSSTGTVVVGAKHDQNLGLIVSALVPGTSATLTVATARTGYAAGSAMVTGSALLAALTPTFSVPVPTATGFTVNVTNYNAAYAFTQKTSAGHVTVGVASGATLPLTVQLDSRSTATITVTTTRTGYVVGHATVAGNKLANAALTPTFSTPVSTATGFTVNVTNYDPAFTFTPTTSAGKVSVRDRNKPILSLSVTGLAPGASAILTVATTRTNYVAGSATVTGSALLAALVPTFSTPVPTTDGFTVNVTNFNPAFTFTPKVSKGHVTAGIASGATLPLTVTGVTSQSNVKITVTVTRTGYAIGQATVKGTRGQQAALVPTFSTPVSTVTGFRVNVTNYNPAFRFTPTTSAGRMVVGERQEHTLRLNVTGLTLGVSATITVATARNNYVAGSASVTGTALFAALIPTFSTPVPTASGFTVNVTNFNAAFTFTPKVSRGQVVAGVASGSILPLTVTGLNSQQNAKVTVTATRTGYVTGHANMTGITR